MQEDNRDQKSATRTTATFDVGISLEDQRAVRNAKRIGAPVALADSFRTESHVRVLHNLFRVSDPEPFERPSP
jgi:hypothetical protein